MARIKSFLLDDSGTAEASSIVIMIAAVGTLLAGALAIYYGGVNGFFTSVGAAVDGYAGKVPPSN